MQFTIILLAYYDPTTKSTVKYDQELLKDPIRLSDIIPFLSVASVFPNWINEQIVWQMDWAGYPLPSRSLIGIVILLNLFSDALN